MPKYTLHYFNMMGRAEPIRLAFALADKDFEDKRLTPEEWKEFKPNTPVGQLPVLEVDGKMLSQSGAILRYVGSEFGMDGKGAWEKAKVNEIVGIIDDIVTVVCSMRHAKDEEAKMQVQKNFMEKVPPLLVALEKLIKGSKSGFFMDSGVTIADLFCCHIVGMATYANEKLLADTPSLAESIRKVSGLPQVKAWLEKRPKTTW